jgi:hypothetical protein
MIILIDNDKLIHLGWKLRANKTGLRFCSFFSVEEFLREKLSTEAVKDIYIDSDLGNGVKGEDDARHIYELGYQNITLTTGYIDFDKSKYPWLKEVISKTPPF